ncbi:MAG: NUDIX domain-containing protein [Candidatus Hydrogenedentota bacterium]
MTDEPSKSKNPESQKDATGAGTFQWTPLVWNFCPICALKLIEAHDGQDMRPHCPDCNKFYYYNPVPAACCFLTNADGELLMVQRSVEPRKGLWTLPGGFVESGETTEEAALRELEEETGLIGSGVTLLGASSLPGKTTGGVIVLAYTVDSWEGEMEAKTDAMDLGFFSLEKRPEVAFEVHMNLLEIYDAQRQAT